MTVCEAAVFMQLVMALMGPPIPEGYARGLSVSCIEADGSWYTGTHTWTITPEDQRRYRRGRRVTRPPVVTAPARTSGKIKKNPEVWNK